VAALLALVGVVVLVLPVLQSGGSSIRGELLGLTASLFWTNYGRQCRVLGQSLSGAAVSAHTMFRAGVILLPFALLEISGKPLIWEAKLFWVQSYCIIGGGILAFALWNNALRHWKTSEVYLFINLIPLSTMLWAHFCLGEKITGNFWFAMALIVAGVAIGQGRWEKLLGRAWVPAD
jgi:drug/metabolite transporter (DMT)-like permease